MANYGKYVVGVRLLLLKEYLEANAGRNRYTGIWSFFKQTLAYSLNTMFTRKATAS